MNEQLARSLLGELSIRALLNPSERDHGAAMMYTLDEDIALEIIQRRCSAVAYARGARLEAFAEHGAKLREAYAIIAGLRAQVKQKDDEIDITKQLEASKLPCGHNARYGFTDDGGKTGYCTLCAVSTAEQVGIRKAAEAQCEFCGNRYDKIWDGKMHPYDPMTIDPDPVFIERQYVSNHGEMEGFVHNSVYGETIACEASKLRLALLPKESA